MAGKTYPDEWDEDNTEKQQRAVDLVNEWEENGDIERLAGRLRSFIRAADDEFVEDVLGDDLDAQEEE